MLGTVCQTMSPQAQRCLKMPPTEWLKAMETLSNLTSAPVWYREEGWDT